MKFQLLLGILVVIFLYFKKVSSHGMLMQPVNRGSAWRAGFKTPINYDDNANFCGGFDIQYGQNNGKCGVCGDDYNNTRPRENENTGTYGTGIIVQSYNAGETIHVIAEITANHKGHFQFQLCPLNYSKEIEEEECFEKYPLPLVNGSYKYQLPNANTGFFETDIVLPKEISCDHCVLRWEYICGNNWGTCTIANDSGAMGCGSQETFKSCSDIRIY